MFDTLFLNIHPQLQEGLRKSQLSSGLWRACLASSLLCDLGKMLNHSGLWHLNLDPTNSKAFLVSARLPGLLHSERVVEGLRGGQTPSLKSTCQTRQGAASTQRKGHLFLISAKMLYGLEVALSGLKRWDSKKA